MNRADVCVAALAEAFRGDGEILANPIGPLPRLAGRLAAATFEPRLLLLERDVFLTGPDGDLKGWNPYGRMFDLVWSGRRHVVMGAAQLDRFGNQNLSAIGADPDRPARQLLGFRGAAGNTVNHPTSYWIPRHSPGSWSSGSTWSAVSATTGPRRSARTPPGSTRSAGW